MVMQMWAPSKTCMSLKANKLALESMVTIEKMKYLMMKNIMMLIMPLEKSIGMTVATTMITTIMEKVVLVALWLVVAVVMANLVMLATNACITTWNQTKKVPTKK
jgi:hypothetical protein